MTTELDLIEQYRATPEFQAYLAAKAYWEAVHQEYRAARTDTNHTKLNLAQHAMNDKLAVCRELAIHKETFGW